MTTNNVTYQAVANNSQCGSLGANNNSINIGNGLGIAGNNSGIILTCTGCNNPLGQCACYQIYGTGGSGGLYPTGVNTYPNSGVYGLNYPSTTTTITLPYRSIRAPRKGDCPSQVYFNGKLLTLGILGSDVECAFTGEHFVFSPGTAEYFFGPTATLIIEYGDEIYHYKVDAPDSKSKLNAKLQSVICKQK